MRRALGDGYVDALRNTVNEVPESSDFVMYWWNQAADALRKGEIQRFGFITTNSLRQTFNRRVIERHAKDKTPLSLVFAIPDHPWVDADEGAAVRIAMTVAEAGEKPGILGHILSEQKTGEEAREIVFRWTRGKIHENLALGADTASADSLRANESISSPGVKLHGSGFIVERDEAQALKIGAAECIEVHIREYRNGRDLTQSPRDVLVIDLFGLDAEEARARFPALLILA